MQFFRRAYEPIGTILDPVSSPGVARDTLQNITFIFLAINAGVSLTLIMAALCTVAGYSRAILALGITYVVLFLLTVIAGCFLYLRVRYFKSHPLPGTPTPGQANVDNDSNLDGQRRSMEQGGPENTPLDAEFQDIELGDIGAHHTVSDSYDQPQYYPPHPQNPYEPVDGGHIADESHYATTQEHLENHCHEDNNPSMADVTSKYARSSIERGSRGSFEYNDNGQDTITTRPITYHEAQYAPQNLTHSSNRLRNANSVVEVEQKPRRLPFSPSLAQLSSRQLGERRNYESVEEARADLRSNWRNGNN
ncbi:uncharacterized protein GGS22DRAFT_196230 [Annulohypoxylon maeteangense]|uniref:uncharacterized protein n=1 Tax=Annulohypoxylon maeteangense TaxID=1927788 RepID=UPI00200722E7|nr:uncharacterized protein GGS22DRAFT_196230 [Annulohypoxylon maeteangense]KAI0882085.1 hypothetical protein GGS22DRAFT_196230 [Annulohypoxylon maeteangense]